MTKNTCIKIRFLFTGLITIGIWSLLIWDYYHGGVPSHHIMQQEHLPAISNWWGVLLLPFLTLFLTYRVQKRLAIEKNSNTIQLKFSVSYIYSFLSAIIFGIILSVFITLGYSNLAGYTVYALLPLALFFPIYRAEYFLGFVIGMTYTVGAVLPTIVGTVFSIVGILLYRYVRPGIIFIIRNIFSLLSPNKNNIK